VGADWIEVDLHVSADGTPIVIHDQSVDRTTDGSGQVARLDDDALSRLDAGSWAGPGFAGQRLPKLDTLLADVSTRGGRLLLELKGEWSPGAVASVAGSIIDAGMADRTLVQSFAAGTLAHLRDIAPMVERCLLRTVPREEDMALVDELEAIAYNPSVRGFFLRRTVVDLFLDAGCGVLVWTVDDPASWEKLLGAGVHGIITNRPAALQGYVAARFEARAPSPPPRPRRPLRPPPRPLHRPPTPRPAHPMLAPLSPTRPGRTPPTPPKTPGASARPRRRRSRTTSSLPSAPSGTRTPSPSRRRPWRCGTRRSGRCSMHRSPRSRTTAGPCAS
jgi:glycerophosphoryl diester phosphodiesterase